MDIKQEALQKHYEWQGKLEITARAHVTNSKELSLAYTPAWRSRVWKFRRIIKRALN